VVDSGFEDAVRGRLADQRLGARPALVDDVHDVLVDMLMHHRFAPGERLNIDGLARSLGVSPTPVREALARMEADGMVHKEARRGYTVPPLIGLAEMRGLIDVRLLLEPAMAAMAARNVTPEQGEALRALSSSGGAGGPDAANRLDANRLDMEYDAAFHDTIAQIAGNPWLRESLRRLRSHVHMYRLYHHAEHSAATKPEHVAIAEAIADGDAESAEAAMRAHLQRAIDRLDEVFESDALTRTIAQQPGHGGSDGGRR
jgi:DNA-binding GntR family transcriptional regulator